MSERMGPDEISELAECLWDACRGRRLHVPVQGGLSQCCPLTVAFPGRERPPLGDRHAGAFMRGFDGCSRNGYPREMFELGRRFREQALGEGFK